MKIVSNKVDVEKMELVFEILNDSKMHGPGSRFAMSENTEKALYKACNGGLAQIATRYGNNRYNSMYNGVRILIDNSLGLGEVLLLVQML